MAATPSIQRSGPPDPSRAIWTAIILLAATPVGSATGLLSAAGGMSVPLAIIAGGGAFGGTVALLLALAQFLARNQTR
ncbi:hypothetical protein [Micromonospora echinofusca]|uniref:hypothetical protein n=1 Tax=Micromonospora echinofusca TaxID=47858 RepID=UPI0034108BC2